MNLNYKQAEILHHKLVEMFDKQRTSFCMCLVQEHYLFAQWKMNELK